MDWDGTEAPALLAPCAQPDNGRTKLTNAASIPSTKTLLIRVRAIVALLSTTRYAVRESRLTPAPQIEETITQFGGTQPAKRAAKSRRMMIVSRPEFSNEQNWTSGSR